MDNPEEKLYKIEDQLVEAERKFALYATAPFGIIWSLFIAIIGFILSFYDKLFTYGKVLFVCIAIFTPFLFFCITYNRLKKEVIPKLEELRKEKIKIERELVKMDQENVLKYVGKIRIEFFPEKEISSK